MHGFKADYLPLSGLVCEVRGLEKEGNIGYKIENIKIMKLRNGKRERESQREKKSDRCVSWR